jgi:hypothetical protein
MMAILYCDGFPQGITVTSDNSVGVRQPSDGTTVGDRFLRQLLTAGCRVMMTCTLRNNKRSVFSVFGRCRGYINDTAHSQTRNNDPTATDRVKSQ